MAVMNRMLLAAMILLLLLAAANTARADEQWWEGWEPKRTLPTQALDTLDEQAVTLTPPVEVVAPDPAVADVDQWRPILEAHFQPDRVADAAAVMRCESRGYAYADNPHSTARGLFQFIRSTWNWVAGILGLPAYGTGIVYDGHANIKAAAWLSAGGTDWTHWVCQP